MLQKNTNRISPLIAKHFVGFIDIIEDVLRVGASLRSYVGSLMSQSNNDDPVSRVYDNVLTEMAAHHKVMDSLIV